MMEMDESSPGEEFTVIKENVLSNKSTCTWTTKLCSECLSTAGKGVYSNRCCSHDYDSPILTTGINNENLWYFQLKFDKSYEKASLVVNLTDSPHENVGIVLRVSILKNKFEKLNTKEWLLYLSEGKEKTFEFIENFPDLRDFSYTLLPKGNLTLQFVIDHINGQKINSIEEDWLNDFKSLMHNEMYSDITLVVENIEFHVHKLILVSRSPVFFTMFQQQMKETLENKIVIEDISYEVMQEVLRFIYTNQVEKIEDLAIDLIAAAEKYGLKHLKMMCSEVLSQNLNQDNALETLNLADLYKANHLKNKSLDFIASHFQDLNSKLLIDLYPHLIKDILMAIQSI